MSIGVGGAERIPFTRRRPSGPSDKRMVSIGQHRSCSRLCHCIGDLFRVCETPRWMSPEYLATALTCERNAFGLARHLLTVSSLAGAKLRMELT